MSNDLTFTLMGCGSSPGVPRPNGDWGNCDPKNPKNRRTRPSLLVERFGPEGVTRVVIDTGPDFRAQMIRSEAWTLDAVLYTHAHADHIHGIDDIRSYFIDRRSRIPVYAEAQTIERLYEGFRYIFETPEGSSYPAIAKIQEIKAGDKITIDGKGGPIEAQCFHLTHGDLTILGYRFGNFAYCTDTSAIPECTNQYLQNLDVLVIDALQYRAHPSHFSVDQAVAEIQHIAPKRAILTHMHVPLDYETLRQELPEMIEPGYDGFKITL